MELQELTRDEVLYIMSLAHKRVDKFLPYINQYAPIYGVTSTLRMAHFLAQIAHESGQLQYVQEIASGKAYEGRKDLGNTVKGDGVKYKGRGLIQITGKANYKAVSKALGVDFLAHPEKLEEPQFAVASALWYWQSHGCNELADKDDSLAVTKRINGGTNGLDDRLRYLGRARQVFRELCMIVCLAVLLVSCTTTQYVPVETVRTERVTVHDSVIIETTVHDSTVTYIKGDTVLIEHWRDRWRDRIRDSVRTDTVTVPYPVERKLSK